jgi:hypothetical protein
LAKARLLIVSQDGDDRMVEVAHEALLRKWPRLRSWLDDDREFLAGKQQLEEDLRDWERATEADKTGALLTGLKLIRARRWLSEHPRQLTAEERALVQASIDHAEAEEKRRQVEQERRLRDAEALVAANEKTAQRTKIGLVIASVLFVLAGGAGIVAYVQKRQAEYELGRSQRLIYVNHIQSAQREWKTNNAASAWDHMNATHEGFRGWEYRYLYNLFTRNQETLGGHSKPIKAVAFSPDGSQIVSASTDGTLKRWDTITRKLAELWPEVGDGVTG